MATRAKPTHTRQELTHQKSERRRIFIESYMATGGNITQAALAAGYAKKSASQQGRRLLQDAQVVAGIKERAQGDIRVDTRVDRQAFWTSVRKDETQKMADRLKATELLGRSQADFIEVRVNPILSDPHASVESLTERLLTIAENIKARRALQSRP